MTEFRLQPTGRSHLGDLRRLWNDPAVMQSVGFPDGLGLTRADVEAWLGRLTADEHRHHFVIVDAAGTCCGEAYYAIDDPPDMAGLDIKLFADRRGQGTATAALRRLIDLVFAGHPDVRAVWTEPAASNEAARRLYRRCGLAPSPRPSHLPPGPSYWSLDRNDWTR